MLVLTSGFLVSDVIAADLPRVASPTEVIFTPSGIHLHVGGHPANVAIDLVKMGLDPKEISVVGAIGEDLFGDFIENHIKSYGLNVFLQRVPEVGTTKNMILAVRGEDRRFHIDLGASWNLDPDYVRKTLKRFSPKIFYSALGITGIDVEINRILRESRRTHSLTFVDIIKPYGKDWDFILPSLKYIDIFHCNEAEALSITGEASITPALKKLVSFGTRAVLVTKGENGALLAAENIEISQPSFKVESIDPTGAGDAFCAGTIYKLIESSYDSIQEINSEKLADILMYGQATGALACTKIGTTTAVSRDGVNGILSRQKKRVKERTAVTEIT